MKKITSLLTLILLVNAQANSMGVDFALTKRNALNTAYSKLTTHISDIEVDTKTTEVHLDGECETHIEYLYDFKTPDAKIAFKEYKTASESFYKTVELLCVAYGTILGTFATIADKALGYKAFNKTTMSTTAVVAVGIILNQNYEMGTTPQYNLKTLKSENLFKNISIETAVKSATTLGFATAAYALTTQGLKKAIELKTSYFTK